ncbi:Tryptophan 7-halogenase [Saliniradius amylolyticus]|uniref:Tryptophan 7-halogenase n=1 Tax=Saliniradius amylolyticus TaxID=2183582 RepID=A0A2S2DZN9_9ALTE|nr:tryptophan halogenase family protein [Saliniradius amylolyticus]AWL10752.1 Tryptophan 7-halogenase [Saliniradius amylolyticus]
MNQSIQRILVVGGGTAGWLSAAYLAKSLRVADPNSPYRISLVESPDIPTIGVGEGTWPTLRNTLRHLGISETRFLRQCCASFKQASKFIDWQQSPKNGQHNHYYHLFDLPGMHWPFSPAGYWAAGLAGDTPYADAISVQAKVCEAGLAPKQITTPDYQGLLNYAYHLDAGKFAELLTEVATGELGVTHIQANVTEVQKHNNGDIAAVGTDRAGLLEADLFIDCTGFQSLLLGQSLEVPFKSLSDVLFTDRAVVAQVPHTNEDTELASCTLSTAQQAGWIWDIGLTNRRGVGHVYSSNHTDKTTAEESLRRYIGSGHDALNYRHLSMQVGHREKFWHRNCVAIGLSAAFMEPLEASAIFLIEAACYMVADQFPKNRQVMDTIAGQFNDSFRTRWQKVVDFIKLHYVLSGRTDNAFWLDNKDPSSIPDSLKQKLELWRHQLPSRYDFSFAFEPFTQESYEFILFGMTPGKLPEAGPLDPDLASRAREQFERIQTAWTQVNSDLPSHRALLNRVQQQGFYPS